MNKDDVFREYLKKMIKKTDLSLNKLGKKAGIDGSYLSKILNGESKPPSFKILNKLARHLPCSYTELMIKAGYLTDESINRIMNERDSLKVPVLKGFPDLKEIQKGASIISKNNVIDYRIYPNLSRNKDRYFYLKVYEDMVIDSKLSCGQLLLVDRNSESKNEDLIVVLFKKDKLAIARLFIKNNNYILHTESEPILLEKNDYKILGKVIRCEIDI